MAEERYPEKFCKLKKTTVTVLEKGVTEAGRDGAVGWKFVKCLNLDTSCDNLDCKYVHKGIGDSGNIDPFD